MGEPQTPRFRLLESEGDEMLPKTPFGGEEKICVLDCSRDGMLPSMLLCSARLFLICLGISLLGSVFSPDSHMSSEKEPNREEPLWDEIVSDVSRELVELPIARDVELPMARDGRLKGLGGISKGVEEER
jgi:hypothetical protein